MTVKQVFKAYNEAVIHNGDLLDILDADMIARDPRQAGILRRSDIVIELVGLRKRLRLTQSQVAAQMGVTKSVVGRIESEPHRMSMDKIFAYAVAMGAEIVIKMPPEVAA